MSISMTQNGTCRLFCSSVLRGKGLLQAERTTRRSSRPGLRASRLLEPADVRKIVPTPRCKDRSTNPPDLTRRLA
jgi:hypothetical protein